MAMPMARLVQVVRVASEADAREHEERRRESLHDAAFIGWQVYQVQPSWESSPKKRMDFAEWLRTFGLSTDGKPPPPPEDVAEWRARCLATAERVRQMDRRIH